MTSVGRVGLEFSTTITLIMSAVLLALLAFSPGVPPGLLGLVPGVPTRR